MDHRQATQYFILTANRQRKNVSRNFSQSEERTVCVILRDGLRYYRRTHGERLREFWSRGYQRALLVVNDNAHQVFSVPEALHQALQFPVRTFLVFCIPRPLDIAGETLTQHLGATLQIAAQSALFSQHFVIGKAERNQGDADNQRNDEANTQQSHARASCSGILGRGARLEQSGGAQTGRSLRSKCQFKGIENYGCLRMVYRCQGLR